MNYFAPVCARRQARTVASHLFVFTARPVTRRLAIQLVDALPEALAGLPVGRLSDLLFRQREQLRYRSQLEVSERIYVDLGRPRHAAKSLESPSKPIAPGIGRSLAPDNLRTW